MAKSSFTRTSSSANKSWVELCDEENDYLSDAEEEESSRVKEFSEGKSEESVEVQTCTAITVKSEVEENCQDENTPIKNFAEAFKKEIKTESENNSENLESPSSFSYASILKNSASKGNISASPCTPQKPIVKEETSDPKPVKREIQREFLQDDLSLTSHLDVFHMQSPMKLEPVDEEMASPQKSGRSSRTASKRFCPSKLSMSEDAMMPDDVLMPSPKKVTRLSSRRKREPGESPMNHKRSKHSSESCRTPRCVVQVSSPKPVEYETDEQVLLRRQKQIDYGKNTVGYERYCQMVPKTVRKREHPQTPNKHVKYSRRAWDGLVKVWRQKLHFWDPPSEGGGNIEDLDFSLSEVSSDTSSVRGSLPTTPREPRRSSRTRRPPSSSSESSNADIECSPLKDN